MIKMPLLESHLGSLNQATELVNRFHWFLSVEQRGEHWIVWGGETALLIADSCEAVDGFLYSMGLAYAGIPEPFFTQMIEFTRKDWGIE